MPWATRRFARANIRDKGQGERGERKVIKVRKFEEKIPPIFAA